MSSATLSVKRQNHRVHPCDPQRKPELLNLLIARHPDERILVVTAQDPETLTGIVTADNVAVACDAALTPERTTQYDLLISYDLPDSAAAYMTRLAQVTTYARILLDPAEQNRLYPIETLLGRTILQEVIEGFESAATTVPKGRGAHSGSGHARRDSNTRRDGGKRDHGKGKRTAQHEKGDSRFSGKRAEEKGDGKRKPGKPKFSGANKNAGAGKPHNAPKEGRTPQADAAKSTPKRPPRRIPLPPKKPPEEG
jgi:hypothetical protein